MRSSVKSFRKRPADKAGFYRQRMGNVRADRFVRLRAPGPTGRAVGVNSVSVFQGPARKERKVIDTASTAQIVAAQATASGPNLLNGVAQGAAKNNHVGSQITLKSLYWRFSSSFAATTAGASPVRLLIVYDKDSNGALPAIGDVLNADSITGVNNLDKRDRFITLVDEEIECMGSGGPQAFYRSGYRKLGLPMTFNDTATAVIAAIETGAVFSIVYQNGNIITASPTTSLRVRFRFDDA